VNAKLEIKPRASSKNDALVLDIAARLRAIGAYVAETIDMSPEDAAEQMGRLLDQVNHEHMRMNGAREVFQEFAEVEAEEVREARWNETHEGVDR
jgi:hypothetical protein